jgi:hypothetical protein
MWIAGAHTVASPLHKYWSLLDVTAPLPADGSDRERGQAGREREKWREK